MQVLDTVTLVKREAFRLYDFWRDSNNGENNNSNSIDQQTQ
jgi:hypothetical protein